MPVRCFLKTKLDPYALIPSASGFGVGFGYLNTFSQDIWSTRGNVVVFQNQSPKSPVSQTKRLVFRMTRKNESLPTGKVWSLDFLGTDKTSYQFVNPKNFLTAYTFLLLNHLWTAILETRFYSHPFGMSQKSTPCYHVVSPPLKETIWPQKLNQNVK